MALHWFAIATLALVSCATARSECHVTCGPSAVRVRDPPAIGSPSFAWRPPPTGWIYKPWNQVLTTNAQAAVLRNFQWDPTPLNKKNPDGAFNDLSTFQLPGNATVFTSYGVATPNSEYVAVFDYKGTGILENATSQYSWLGWGCDGNGKEYYLSYSTASEASGTPPGLDIMSVVDTGLDQDTAAAVIARLKKSHSKVIRAMAGKFVSNIQDGGRRDLGRITECDEECKTNKGLIGII